VTRTPTDDFGDRHTDQLILHSYSVIAIISFKKVYKKIKINVKIIS